MEGKKITSVFEIGSSYSLLGFDDGTAALVKVVNPELSTEEVDEMVTGLLDRLPLKESTNETNKEEDSPAEDSPDEDGYNWEDLSEMKFKELKSLCDENDLDTDPDDFEKSEEAGLREAIAKELEIEVPTDDDGSAEAKTDDAADDDSYSWDDLSKFDYEELKELCDEEDLETDPDDFEEEEEDQLRRAIAKELDIEAPKKKKKKK